MGNGIEDNWPGGSGGGEAPQHWQPPTAVEHRLYEAGAAGDWTTYFNTLAKTDLFMLTRRDVVDARGFEPKLSPFRDPQMEGLCQAVYTRGMLPPPIQGQVFERVTLRRMGFLWSTSMKWLAVNPGTPVETFLPSDPKAWKKYYRKAPDEAKLKTLWTGHLHDETAHGMACGALLLVNNGQLWNHLGWQGQGYSAERESLRQWWDVTNREDWLRSQQALVQGEHSPPVWEFVLRVRQALIAEYGHFPDGGTWREAAERVLLSRTAELVDATGKPPEFDLDSDIALTGELIGRTLRYEARFRADGLLTENAVCRSVLAWDFGRGSSMARWGLGARYCEVDETRHALLAAGAAARQVYHSWADYAAGYVLGRCLHFDDEKFGRWYTEMVDTYRTLMSETDSPWLTVPWNQSSDATRH